MTSTTDRLILIAVTLVAVLAASLVAAIMPAASFLPPAPLVWAIVFTLAVLGAAAAVKLPPARTLVAAWMLLGTVLVLALTLLRQAVDALISVLNSANAAGLTVVSAPTRKAA